MALKMKMNYSSVHGVDIELDAAYIKIESVQSKKDFAYLSVFYYQSQDAFIADRPEFNSEFITFVPSVSDGAENFIKQGYEHLKTLPKFENAINC